MVIECNNLEEIFLRIKTEDIFSQSETPEILVGKAPCLNSFLKGLTKGIFSMVDFS